jgi:hypothetical protein
VRFSGRFFVSLNLFRRCKTLSGSGGGLALFAGLDNTGFLQSNCFVDCSAPKGAALFVDGCDFVFDINETSVAFCAPKLAEHTLHSVAIRCDSMSLRNLNGTGNTAETHAGLFFLQGSPSSLRFVLLTENVIRVSHLYEISCENSEANALLDSWRIVNNHRKVVKSALGSYSGLKCLHRNCLFVCSDGPIALSAQMGEVTFVKSEANGQQDFGAGIIWDESQRFVSFDLRNGVNAICVQSVGVVLEPSNSMSGTPWAIGLFLLVVVVLAPAYLKRG